MTNSTEDYNLSDLQHPMLISEAGHLEARANRAATYARQKAAMKRQTGPEPHGALRPIITTDEPYYYAMDALGRVYSVASGATGLSVYFIAYTMVAFFMAQQKRAMEGMQFTPLGQTFHDEWQRQIAALTAPETAPSRREAFRPGLPNVLRLSTAAEVVVQVSRDYKEAMEAYREPWCHP